jgi:signal transduction histidine kinase
MAAHPLTRSQALAHMSVTLLRLFTWAVGVAMIGLASFGIVTLYTQLQQVCSAPIEVCAVTLQLMPGNLAGVNDPGSALLFHAIWRAGLNAIGRGVCWILALLILRHRSRDPMGLVTALWLFTYGAPFDLFAAVSVYSWLLAPVLALFALNGISFGLFLTLFPRGQFQPRWSIVVAVLWVLYALMNLSPATSLLLTQADQYRELIIIGVLYSSTVLLQAYRYRKLSSITERKQTKWVVFGLLAWWGLSLLARWVEAATLVPTAPITPMYYLAGIGFPVAGLVLPVVVGIAILRHGLFDIDLIINRALVYGALTAFVAGVYMLIVVGVGRLLRVQDSIPLSLLATGLVAIAFNPLRERLQRGANRLLYGQRDEPYAVVAHLGRQLESRQAGGEVLNVIAQTIGQTLKLPYVRLETHDERGWQAEYQEQAVKLPAHGPEQRIAFPLNYGGEQIGVLQITPRTGAGLNSADHTLLQNLARQAGIAVHAAQTTADLQFARERIVTAREEERRRIRRDLHDGLGPQLASQSLKLETARDLIPDQPAHAQMLLNELIDLSQKMLGDIRHLVYALRPPALDDIGLIGALREVVERIAPPTLHIELRVPDVLPPLPAAVEVAVYRITQEALTNVVKHAQATQCTILVGLTSQHKEHDTFILELHDDGLGIAAQARSGVGMHSMRERAEELGGSLIITPNRPRGTVVQVTVPIVKP